jgi:hypothetical protein
VAIVPISYTFVTLGRRTGTRLTTLSVEPVRDVQHFRLPASPAVAAIPVVLGGRADALPCFLPAQDRGCRRPPTWWRPVDPGGGDAHREVLRDLPPARPDDLVLPGREPVIDVRRVPGDRADTEQERPPCDGESDADVNGQAQP